MDIQVRKVRLRFPSKLIAIVAACAILMGCDDNGPTAPTTTRVAPTPLPIPNIAGNWQGHSRTQGPAYFCGGDVPASATFAQDGTLVTGRVTTGARVERDFRGEFRGSQLSGSLTGSGNPTSVTGSAGATYVTLRTGGSGPFCGMTTISFVR